MSRTVQVRNVPDDVHAELRRRAAEAGTSLSDYLVGELARIARRSRNAEVLLRAAQRDRAVGTDAILDALHEGRGAR